MLLIFLLFALCALTLCAYAMADAHTTVSIPMLIEHDAWEAVCEDDAAVPGASGHGAEYIGLNKKFTPGHRYRVRGQLGWSFLLTIDKQGIPAVAQIETGPFLAAPPNVFVDLTDQELKNPVLAIFGPVKEFTVVVPVDYLAWEIPGAYELRVGNRQVELPDGNWTMRGVLGWSLPLKVAGGTLQLAGEPVGLAATAVSIVDDMLVLGAMADANRVVIDVPELLGQYAITDAAGVVVLKNLRGAQTAALPPGEYRLTGEGWTANLHVERGRAHAELPPAQPAGIVCWPDGMALRPSGRFSVTAPWGEVELTLPEAGAQPISLGLGWSEDGASAISLRVETAAVGWRVSAAFIHGEANWPLSATVAALDQANVYPARDFLLTSGEAPVEFDLADAPAGAYMLTVTSPESACCASAVFICAGKPGASLWFAMNRVNYRADEPVEICAWQDGNTADARPMQITISAGGGRRLPLASFSGSCGLFRLASGTLAPGLYEVELHAGDELCARRTLQILPEEPATNFPIHAYQSVLRHGMTNVPELHEVGVRAFLEQSGLLLLHEKRTDAAGNLLAQLQRCQPAVGAVSRYLPQGGRALDLMDKLGWLFFAQWGSAHQPYGYGISFTDPGVVQRLVMTSLWTSQYGRQHPSFLGMNVFDEGGGMRGPWFHNDGNYHEYAAFEQKYGRKKPRFFGEDDDMARAWIYQKQLHHHTVYSAIGDGLEAINRLADPGAHLYLGTQNGNLNSFAVDGGHPPSAYRAITLSTFHWYPGYIYSAFILLGNEYHFMQPQPIEYWPLIWADGHHFLTRHEVNLAISRQVDGVGHFHWPDMITPGTFSKEKFTDEVIRERADDLKRLHARLTRFGDLFRAVRRVRSSEVAVLHSLYSIAPTLMPKQEDRGYAYRSAYRPVYGIYLLLSALLRQGVQAGIVCEEEVLERDGLAGRKILIVPGITEMMPELREKILQFIANGGTVFTDAGATVHLPGAQALPVDFFSEADNAHMDAGDPKSTRVDRAALAHVMPALAGVAKLLEHRPLPGSIDLLVTRQQQGKGQYYFCLNDRIFPLDQLPRPLSEYEVQLYHLPIETSVTLPAHGVVYDVFAGKEVARATGTATLPVQLPEGDMALFAVLPEAVGGVTLRADGALTAGQLASYEVSIAGDSGLLLTAAIPLEIRFLDADGQEIRPTIYRSTHDGIFRGALRVGAFDSQRITISARELLAGHQAQATLVVTSDRATVTELTDQVIVENGRALAPFLAGLHSVYLALGDGPGSPEEEDAAPLAAALRARGIDVEVRRASELARKTFDKYVGRGFFRMQTGVAAGFHVSEDALAGAEMIPEVDRAVIAIGSSQNNCLIRAVTEEHNWTRYADRGFPGPGRALLIHAWQPFSLTENAVLAIAEDAEGISKAVSYLAELL